MAEYISDKEVREKYTKGLLLIKEKELESDSELWFGFGFFV